MPARQSSRPATRGAAEPYYLRLRPVVEYEYVSDAGEKVAEVAVFDDRSVTGNIYAQLKPLFNGRFKKGANATFAFDSPERFKELSEDFLDAYNALTQ